MRRESKCLPTKKKKNQTQKKVVMEELRNKKDIKYKKHKWQD